jgi:anti-sigma regulatory factor (Ser/Thr protein kinase)
MFAVQVAQTLVMQSASSFSQRRNPMIAMAPPRPSRPAAQPQPAGTQQPRATAASAAGDAGGTLRHSRCKLPADLIAAARAREHVSAVISAWELPVDVDVLDVAVLLTSELVANAITHGQQVQSPNGGPALAGDRAAGSEPIMLSVRCNRGELRVEVHDRSSDMPVLPPTDALAQAWAESETGRGLMLVDALADKWGFYRTPAGKAVYFILALHAMPPARLPRRGDGEPKPPAAAAPTRSPGGTSSPSPRA